MSRRAVSQATRMASRVSQSSTFLRLSPWTSRLAPATSHTLVPGASVASQNSLRSFFSTTHAQAKGIMPESDNPAKPEPAANKATSYAAVDLTDAEYHEIADEYLENVLIKFEELQDAREDVDVEFSSGVLTITWPGNGTYVINKQPPNKQIWLSSPISGPKRYDWCLLGESQTDKEGTGEGAWIYARDGSSLSEIFVKELGVNVDEPVEER
ncbi:hypothetical protein BGZ63DRAFT_418749 [Mariannaea sp. PMI_226]|nr:hypothetical protein BGZ63DRAFT_418749 [Mariannaea sp. PMI_226]